jgi:predicted nucleic-acid-binding protein
MPASGERVIALDTNVLVRYALNDDPVLSPLARDLIAGNHCHIGLLALAETGFVLASVYRATHAEIVDLVNRLLAQPTLHFEHQARLPSALSGVMAGVDWFDALLWAGSPAHGLATFDRNFARRATRLGWQPGVDSHLPPRARSRAN